jgi:hypothetical protein
MTNGTRKLLHEMALLKDNPKSLDAWRGLSRRVRFECLKDIQLLLESGILSAQEDCDMLGYGSKEVTEVQGDVIIIKMVTND